MNRLEELFEMIECFLNGQYEALSFSYDAPDFLCDHYDEIEKINPTVCKYLNNELPDICDIYERGDDPKELKRQIKAMLDIVNKIIIDKNYLKTSDFIFCDVEFNSGGKTYCYLADSDSYFVGETVLVPAGPDNREAIGQIVDIRHFSAIDAPFPVYKTKHIIRRIDEDKLSQTVEQSHEGNTESTINANQQKTWKLKYVGESFGVDSLTNGKIYEAWVDPDSGLCRVIDDSGEDYLYSWEKPAPLDGSAEGGHWEIIERGEGSPNVPASDNKIEWPDPSKSKYSWDDDKMNRICARCHYRDKDPDLCHSVEPPIVKSFIPTDSSECYFIADSYWNRIPEERKEEFNRNVKGRSERFHKRNHKGK